MAKTQELQELGEWKVGLPVLLTKGGIGSYESITKITRITDGRGGTVYAGDLSFDIHGRGRSGDKWHSANIQPATEEDRIRIRGMNARNRLSKIKWHELDPKKALEIETLLNSNGIVTKQE